MDEAVVCAGCGEDISEPRDQYGERPWPAPQYCATCWRTVASKNAERADLEAQLHALEAQLDEVRGEINALEEEAAEIEEQINNLNMKMAALDEPFPISEDQLALPLPI